MPKALDPRLGDYVHIEEFARMVNKTRRTITRWMGRPDGLPFLKLGRETHIPLDSARQWIANRAAPLKPTRRKEYAR
jgi:hypothetical protein